MKTAFIHFSISLYYLEGMLKRSYQSLLVEIQSEQVVSNQPDCLLSPTQTTNNGTYSYCLTVDNTIWRNHVWFNARSHLYLSHSSIRIAQNTLLVKMTTPIKTSIGIKLHTRPWQDSNLQSPDPKSGTLSIRPHGPRAITESLTVTISVCVATLGGCKPKLLTQTRHTR